MRKLLASPRMTPLVVPCMKGSKNLRTLFVAGGRGTDDGDYNILGSIYWDLSGF